MDIRHVQAWVGIASLGGVLLMLYEQLSRTSPGPISLTHAQDARLLDRANCALCHGTEGGDMASACAECHPLVAADIRAQRGFHGTLVDVEANECGTCHEEHLGGDFPLVSDKSFALAGFEQRADFDHSSLDFTLQGRHAELGCVDCHANADLLMLPTNERRFQGLEQGCEKCHEDVHEGRIVRACASCHGQEHPFALVASFQHDSFVAENAHAAPACVECHPAGSQQEVELLAGRDAPDCQRTCLDCHESPHDPEFIAGVATLADVAEGASCELCHSEADGSFAGHGESMPPELHAASGFALDAPHNQVACVECHLEVPLAL